MQYLLILALVIAIFSVVFALQNAILIPVNLLVWQTKSSLALVLLITLGVGIGIGILGMAPSLIRKSIKVSSLNKKLRHLQEAIAEKETVSDPQQRIAPEARLPTETEERSFEG